MSISAIAGRSSDTVSWRRSISIKAATALPGLKFPIACCVELDILHVFVELLRESPYRFFFFLLPAFLLRFLPTRDEKMPKSVQKALTIFREHSRLLWRGNRDSTKRRIPTHDVSSKQGGFGDAIYRIRWRSVGREDLRGFGWDPLNALDYPLWGLVATIRQRMV